jgi:hypothetical protein
MNHSDSIAKIAPALLKAQQEIEVAVKDSTNPHFRSKYADLGSVFEACKPALNKNGIVILQTPIPGDTNELRLVTTLLHTSGEWISGTATIPLAKQDPQGYGSALTYGRRYSLASIVGVISEEDDDGNSAARAPAPASDSRFSNLPSARTGTENTAPPASKTARPMTLEESKVNNIRKQMKATLGEKIITAGKEVSEATLLRLMEEVVGVKQPDLQVKTQAGKFPDWIKWYGAAQKLTDEQVGQALGA